jgi:hypothetical protein
MREFWQKNRKRFTLIASLLALIFLTGWAFATLWGEGEMSAARQRRDELFASVQGPDGTPDPLKMMTAFSKFGELRKQEEKKLSPAQRQQLDREGEKRFTEMIQKRVGEYLALPAGKNGRLSQQQLDFLNREIDRMETMRKIFEAGRAVAGVFSQNNTKPNPQGNAGGQSGSPGQAGGPPPGMRPPSDPASRAEWRRARLDRTTPDFRADMAQFVADMNQARRMRGLPVMGQGGPPRR